jgi:hypothetical protein
MHGDDLSYAETFEAALEGLFDGVARVAPGAPAAGGSLAEQARRANEVFERYLRLQGEGRFAEAGGELERLHEMLQRLAAEAEEGG